MVDITYKVCIFGNSGVGKTTLVKRFLTGLFEESTTSTVGVDIAVKYLELNGVTISLQIWDFGGEERFRFFLPTYAAGSFGGIFMYDITNSDSFSNLTEWLRVFWQGADPRASVLMIGSKLDLDQERRVDNKVAVDLAKIYGLYNVIECSSKTGENVELVFEDLTRKMKSLQ